MGGNLPLLFQQRAKCIAVFDLKQHRAGRSAYDIKVPRKKFKSMQSRLFSFIGSLNAA